MIEIVSATRLSGSEFWDKSALGLSLRRLKVDPELVTWIVFSNTHGLPEVYNARIDAANGTDVLVFMHDDVWIDDYYFVKRIDEALQQFDVVGVAGNRRRVPRQPGWAFVDLHFTWDHPENLSGRIAHGKYPFGGVTNFGVTPAPCELLDGVMFAVRKSTLVAHGVRFDPRFAFHLYDMDFCRSARAAGMQLGTWPICITHQSGGNFDSAGWEQTFARYLEKWPD